ncbi:SH3 domain-containing protein [Hymenobacter fodinae]|uniref:SH3 domain-containing protein n=1 Tax=Hymenobacter fodinae TaxID=2510796 RepID=A0A4Z0P162_9BACT|nr:SH3 domain-containing protein [Hymenobacter fodinae]TGE04763.1 SH3 domain-containing protein [Hymenobacter fodinae]
MSLYNHDPLRNDIYGFDDESRHVNWRIILGLIVLFSLAILVAVNYFGQPVPSNQLRHAAAVSSPTVPLYSKASTTDTASHIVGTVTIGDTLDVQTIQADGWCKVVLRDRRMYGDPGVPGYIQQPHLSMADSTKAALL